MGDTGIFEGTATDKTRSERYIVRAKLGEGAFGEVRHGTDRTTGMKVALKFIRVMNKSGGLPRAVFRELEALRQLGCGRHIVKLLDVFPDETQLCLVLEYLDSDLSEVIGQAQAHLPAAHVKAYAHMLLEALSYVHSKRVIHRDIKPSNILLSAAGALKLADFGLARVVCEESDYLGQEPGVARGTPATGSSMQDLSHQVATRWYRPPELLFASRSYTFSADMWSAGVVIAELFALRPVFPGNNDIDQMFRVFQIMGNPTPENWPGVELLPDFNKVCFSDLRPIPLALIIPHLAPQDCLFLESLIVLDPAKRSTASDACNADYFISHPLPSDRFLLPCPHRARARPANPSRSGGGAANSPAEGGMEVVLAEWEKENKRIAQLLAPIK